MADAPEIDGYSDLVQVAKGGFGIVYRARQDRFGREVALKVLTVDDLDDGGRRRFERECLAMGGLSWHPNVVAVYDSGITGDGHPFLAMEYLDAGSLGDRLKFGPMSWQDAVVAGVQVAGALDAAHTAGTLHRDLKPENLLIGPYDEVKLGDFGIAAFGGSTRTTASHASFTVAHVAPEMLKGKMPDERSDLYGLASTLYTLISGAPPFVGDPDEAFATLMARVLQYPDPRLDDVPEDLADLVARTLAKDPADRPRSSEEFGRVLQGIQADNSQPVTDLRLAPATTSSLPTIDAADPGGLSLPSTKPRPGDPQPTVGHPQPKAPRGDPRSTVHLPASQPQSAREQTLREPPPRSPVASRVAPDATHPEPRTRRGLRAAILAAALASLAVLVAAFLITTRNDPGTNHAAQVTDTIEVGTTPAFVAATDTAIWVTNSEDGTVTRIDPATNQATATIPVGGTTPTGVAAFGNAVWVAVEAESTVARIDADTNETSHTIEVRPTPAAVAVSRDSVWVASVDAGIVTRIDPATNETTATIPVGTTPYDLATTDTASWVTNFGDSTVTRIDPATNETTATIPVGTNPYGVDATDSAVWVTNTGDNTVTRIDPATNETTATIPVGTNPYGVDATDSAVWVTNTDDDTVSRIDPATNEVTATINVGDHPVGVAATNTAVWVTNSGDDTVSRIDPSA